MTVAKMVDYQGIVKPIITRDREERAEMIQATHEIHTTAYRFYDPARFYTRLCTEFIWRDDFMLGVRTQNRFGDRAHGTVLRTLKVLFTRRGD